jgi:hypothetical protein
MAKFPSFNSELSVVLSRHKPLPVILIQPIHAPVAELHVVVVAGEGAVVPPFAAQAPRAGARNDTATDTFGANEVESPAVIVHLERLRRTDGAESEGKGRGRGRTEGVRG